MKDLKLSNFKGKFISRTSHWGLTGKKLRYFITIASMTGFSLFGYDQGLMASLITGKQFNYEFPATKENGDHDRHATVVQGATTSCYELGCFAGSLFVMFCGERIGRKPLILMGSVITIIGAVISTCAFRGYWALGQFIIGRVVTGVGTGLNTSTIPVWQSEMSKAENRGLLVNLEGSTIAFGTMIAYWIDFGFSYTNSSVQWRFPVSMQIVFALFLLAFMIKLPESPRWLISQSRTEEARYLVGTLDDADPNDEEVITEVAMLHDAVNRTKHEKHSLSSLFSRGRSQNLQRALIAASTQFFQQFTGCNAAIYYSTVLFNKTIKLDYRLSMIIGGVFATIYALSTIGSFFLIEMLGRRKLFLLGATGQAVSFTITFACLVKENKENARGAAVGLFLFITFFGLSLLSLPWIYPPEIASMKVRASTNAFSTCTNWLCNFAVVMFTPIFIGQSGWGCYLFFAVMNYLYIPVIFFFYPETAGRSLEEIDIIFAKAYEDGTQPWRVANHLPKLSLQEVEDHANALGSYDDEMEKEDFGEDRVEDTYNQINGDNSSSSSNIKNEDTVNDKANFEG
ncbi:BTE_HP_G0176260.mRNA.1.CDS.1 [Saccharomyces cerevisiae]|nr:BTE_HP_G0092120.mRNA.1.CDS.1 [Saccharomyces cerevisiae]CAI5204081.1 BTE_HP_G0149650.mRNA.1.CDS.1 [Saccharomyces cerevisiae]CAI5212643.1 BTE_HP_G0171300.mRNA.1.CDS.1 [Saccharomyces cerevisiae]CAI5214128.1 BTE_HP_G0176260.mRNA.1.CDS.1 [Saccharomyces cerevisiae]CAI6955857.1 BTE_HP_G0092120.mRNA.1.CDS.1 [Saccharomyces cerevisiae]